jgi:hypothetical protein
MPCWRLPPMPASSFRSFWRLQASVATENAERRRRSCRNSEIAYHGLGFLLYDSSPSPSEISTMYQTFAQSQHQSY